jgi:hypothetical protein
MCGAAEAKSFQRSLERGAGRKMRKPTLRRHVVNVNEEWPLHPDVSRSGGASIQLNDYRIGCGWKKNLVGISMPGIQNHPPPVTKL